MPKVKPMDFQPEKCFLWIIMMSIVDRSLVGRLRRILEEEVDETIYS